MIDAAVETAPAGALVVIALHHHILPLPEEHLAERVSSFMGWPFTAELERGRELLDRVQGRCGLILHGHRHLPRGVRVENGRSDVRIYNAGSSTELGGARIFEHVNGALVSDPWWLRIGAPARAPWTDADAANDATAEAELTRLAI
jgi:hypothetical protein